MKEKIMPKVTPFYKSHIELGAKIMNFHGWKLPVQYSSTLKEYKNVRSECGIFDTSHMGRIIVKGKEAKEFLQYVCTNNVGNYTSGEMMYTTACNKEGKMLDDFMIYCFKNKYICIVNAANRIKMLNWFKKQQNNFSVKIKDISDKYGMFALQGPFSKRVLSKYVDLSNLYYLEVTERKCKKGILIVSRSGYTGEDGFEVTAKNDTILWLWDKLVQEDKDKVYPCGLAARDMLRLEMGYSLYGADIEETVTPLEANLKWIVDLEKDFIGKDILIPQSKKGVSKLLKGFMMKEKAVPRLGYNINYRNKKVGRVTSGGYSPKLNKFIGLGYVEHDISENDKDINIEIRGKNFKANMTSIPFISPKVKRRSNVT